MARASRPKTGFDTFVETQMHDPEFAAAYAEARSEVDAIDRLVRTLDETRVRRRLSKARLAELIDAKPEVIRRLFTAESPNPTITTVTRIAKVLGLRVELVPATSSKSAPRRAAKPAASARRTTGTRRTAAAS